MISPIVWVLRQCQNHLQRHTCDCVVQRIWKVASHIFNQFLSFWILQFYIISFCFLQVQSGVVGVLASCIALVLSSMSKHHVSASSALVLLCSACVTSFLTALFLGSLTCLLVIMCHRFRVNPDNVAAPLAASLGDVTTLSILALSAQFLFSLSAHGPMLLLIVMFITLLPVPGCCWIAWKSEFTNDVMRSGWAPVILSMTISR